MDQGQLAGWALPVGHLLTVAPHRRAGAEDQHPGGPGGAASAPGVVSMKGWPWHPTLGLVRDAEGFPGIKKIPPVEKGDSGSPPTQ